MQPVAGQLIGNLGGIVQAVDDVRFDDDAALNRHFHAAGFKEPDRVPSQSGVSQVRGRPRGTDDAALEMILPWYRAHLSYSVSLSLSTEGVAGGNPRALSPHQEALDWATR